jgi:hypothetical protein
MIYMKLLLFCLLIATTVAQGHRHHRRDRRRRLQKERYVCTIDDTEHCQDPTESYMISCSMDTCAWATDELKSDKWPSECDTLYVSQEEIDQQIVPDWWEPCLLWVQMFGPPPPPQTGKYESREIILLDHLVRSSCEIILLDHLVRSSC